MNKLLRLLIIVLAFFWSCSAMSSNTISNSAQVDLNQLSAIVQKCVFRKDTSYPVFNGCVDWHSAVHGHWALLWSSYVLEDKQLMGKVLSRFTEQGMELELGEIKKHDARGGKFEMPYGRAWYLQLARDTERYLGQTELGKQKAVLLRPLADYLYTTLLDYAKTAPANVVATDYQNSSWYLFQLYLWALHNNYQADLELIRGIAKTHFSPVLHWPDFRFNKGFFAPRALAVLLWSSMDQDTKQLKMVLSDFSLESLVPLKLPFQTAHQGGLNFSRSWGLAALLNRAGKARYRDALLAHRKIMLESANYWAGDYQRYGHWVAQFGIFSYYIESKLNEYK